MIKRPDTTAQRQKRHRRVRSKISGTPDCPRLNVFRSGKHIYAQLIDDVNMVTICAASSVEKDFEGSGGNKDGAKKVGMLVAQRAKSKGIEAVKFDRGGYLYHGRIKELADGAREGGLNFLREEETLWLTVITEEITTEEMKSSLSLRKRSFP